MDELTDLEALEDLDEPTSVIELVVGDNDRAEALDAEIVELVRRRGARRTDRRRGSRAAGHARLARGHARL